MYEHRSAPLLPFRRFVRRLLSSMALVFAFVGLSLALGILGYHSIAHMSWIDALLNASMILAGMGPVDELRTGAAKVFASAYALFSGVVFISSIGVIAAPIAHRFLHKFHLEERRKPER
jgi:hypothetical protein